jgi:hypothetical protein
MTELSCWRILCISAVDQSEKMTNAKHAMLSAAKANVHLWERAGGLTLLSTRCRNAFGGFTGSASADKPAAV